MTTTQQTARNTREPQATEAQAYEALRLAQIHSHEGTMASSAKLAAQDAEALFNRGEYGYARKRAQDSLAFSVGVFHADYIKAGQ